MEEIIMSRANHPIIKSLTTAVLVALAWGGTTAQADPPCTNATLEGTYSASTFSIREEVDGMDYCNEYSRVEADGAGRITGVGVNRCTLHNDTPVSESGSLIYYSVNRDCSVTFTDVRPDGSLGEVSHGLIVMRGDMVLLDGTTRRGAEKLFHGVAVRVGPGRGPRH
jgi:hypothetical protein